jgi:ankyrin repeat protein
MANALRKATRLFSGGKTYTGVDDPHLLKDCVALLRLGKIPITQFRYDDGTRGDEYVLHFASATGACEVIQTLLDHGADVNGLDLEGRTALFCATEHGQEAATRLLIQRGADASIRTAEGYFALQNLWMFENDVVLSIAQLLINVGGADVNALSETRTSDVFYKQVIYGTALHVGVTMRHFAVVRTLLELGADINLRPSSKLYTPLEMASSYHFPEIIELLLGFGARLANCDSDTGGWPGWALHTATQHTMPLLRYCASSL